MDAKETNFYLLLEKRTMSMTVSLWRSKSHRCDFVSGLCLAVPNSQPEFDRSVTWGNHEGNTQASLSQTACSGDAHAIAFPPRFMFSLFLSMCGLRRCITGSGCFH